MNQQIELLIHVPRSLFYFHGHFPDFAILPGMVQIDWALMLARRYMGLSSGPVASMRVKFTKPITPGADLQLTLDYTAARRELRFEYRDDRSSCGSGRIELHADGI